MSKKQICSNCGKVAYPHRTGITSYLCKECLVEKQREDGKKHFIERLNSRYPTFEYVSGNPNNDGRVVLKCKICGECVERNSQCVRGKNNLTCFNCLKVEQIKREKRRKMLKEQRISLIKKDNERRKEIKNLYNEIKKNTIYITNCKRCGIEIYTRYSYQKLCNKCGMKQYDKSHSNKSLKKLYERDKGICYICGNKCDYEDYIYRGNTFIAGNYYPSIDHIIPLAKGGTDDWNNLKLAHRICNSIKRDEMLDRGY